MLNAAPVSEIPLTIHWHYCQSKSLSSKWICVEHYFPHTSGIIAVVSTHFQDDQVRLIHLGRFDLFFFASVVGRYFIYKIALSLAQQRSLTWKIEKLSIVKWHKQAHNRSIPLGQPVPDNNDAGRIPFTRHLFVVFAFSQADFEHLTADHRLRDGV